MLQLNDAVQEIGMTINFEKYKIMTNIVPSDQIQINNNEIELVDKCAYLGHEIRITRDNQACELNRRTTLGRTAYEKRDIFEANILIRLKQKECILQVLIYGAETLTLINK